MLKIESVSDIHALSESMDVELKAAKGRDGKGQLPKDFWPTYSAFANTAGGTILLGVEELRSGEFIVCGIEKPSKIIDELVNNANNSQKVSANLIDNDRIKICSVDGHEIIQVEVPQATRIHKPVFVGPNPLTGTYVRRNTADQKCSEETVKRWIAEQRITSRDSVILPGYGIDDLDRDSIAEYRQLLRDKNPDHPFLDFAGYEFLTKIQAIRTDRESGVNGLTAAGLLMFGTYQSIQDEFPTYHLDYQERPRAVAEARWIDRLTLDGTWPGNVFQFFRKAYRKLTADLKVPFSVTDGQAVGDTLVHQALREALVNALVHADYSLPASILVVRRPDMFGFRNPGLMRVPAEVALKGGESDGRNRLMQRMFTLVGFGEQAGSGLPTITRGWGEQHWAPPKLTEVDEPNEQTRLELHMVDLMPAETIAALESEFGEEFKKLSSDDRTVLAAAHSESAVTHSRLLSFLTIHPTDLSRNLQRLVQNRFLVQSGHGRGAAYYLPSAELPSPDDPFEGVAPSTARTSVAPQTSGLPSESPNRAPKVSTENSEGIELREIDGLPVIEDIDALPAELKSELENAAAGVRAQRRCPPTETETSVLQICRGRFVTLPVLASLMGRSSDYLRQSVLKPLIDAKKLRRAYPQSPNHPSQAYAAETD
jgi:predicted HTH transcriptional regulator